MATWTEVGKSSLQAARTSMAAHPRSSVSRFYYAAYSFVVSALPAGMSYRLGWRNPPHADVTKLIDQNITGLSFGRKKRLKAAMRRLLEVRIDADYRPGRTVAEEEALSAHRDVVQVMRVLEVQDS